MSSRIVDSFRSRHLQASTSYTEWLSEADTLDRASGAYRWRHQEPSKLYDNDAIRARFDELLCLRRDNNAAGVMFALNEGIHGNLGKMGNPALYHEARAGTKVLIEKYVDEVVDALEYLASFNGDAISPEERLDFFRRASHCYGRPALLLSGAGSLGFYHIGVIRALHQAGLLPDCISGASAGSLATAMLGSHSDSDLGEILDFESGSSPWKALMLSDGEKSSFSRMFRGLETAKFEYLIDTMVPDLTFQEAFEHTGRAINISVSPYDRHQTSRLLNAITAPNVLIRSAVLASCALPGLHPPRILQCKDANGEIKDYSRRQQWIDGSVTDDLPMKRLSRLYGVNFFIVSQANPIALRLMNDPKGRCSLRNTVARYATTAMKECIDLSYMAVHRYAPNRRAEQALGTLQSIVGQQYTGDVTIPARFKAHQLMHGIAELPPSIAQELCLLGERSTWPKIGMIRNCTVIAKKLLQVRSELEKQLLTRAT